MAAHNSPFASFCHFVHKYFIWLLLGSYLVAAVLPGLGQALRGVSFGEVVILHEKTHFTLPVLLLAFLLFNAGLGVQTGQLKNMLRRPLPLAMGLAANLLVPIVYIFGVAQTMRFWHNPDEVQNILLGLALVASMPIAGSSTAWSQNANGNLALSLGLVLFSTFLSPITTPLAMHSVGLMAEGEYARILRELAHSGTGSFLAVAVVVPSLLGIVAHWLVGEARVQAARPVLRLGSSLTLLVLNYSNASMSLPQMIAESDWDLLAAILVIVVGLCALAFASGWLIARGLKADVSQQVALMFGLGMNNNGTGLVLASMALANYPRVLLPIIFYNLVQHAVAGVADALMGRAAAREPQAGHLEARAAA
jgi:BASS family bile acid:Na+ symporter